MILPMVIIYQVEEYRRLISDVNRKTGKGKGTLTQQTVSVVPFCAFSYLFVAILSLFVASTMLIAPPRTLLQLDPQPIHFHCQAIARNAQ